MSVLIEFRRDDRNLSDVSADTDAYLLMHTTLIVPIRMQVNGRDILSSAIVKTERWIVDSSGATSQGEPVDETGWIRHPLIGFVSGLARCIAMVVESGSASHDLQPWGGVVTHDLTADRQAIRVVGPDGDEATMGLDEATTALEAIRSSAKDWLESARPELRLHPMWPDWFPGAR